MPKRKKSAVIFIRIAKKSLALGFVFVQPADKSVPQAHAAFHKHVHHNVMHSLCASVVSERQRVSRTPVVRSVHGNHTLEQMRTNEIEHDFRIRFVNDFV